MSLSKTFYLLKDAERRTGKFYSLIALSVSITQPNLADLLNDLAEEEEQHARQVEMMHNYFLQGPDAFLETAEAEKTIAEFVQNLDTIKNYFNQNFGKIKTGDLVDLALDIERNLVESHQAFIFQVVDIQIKKLFESLNQGNKSHIQRLERFQENGGPSPGA